MAAAKPLRSRRARGAPLLHPGHPPLGAAPLRRQARAGQILDALDVVPDGALPFSKAQIKGVISALVPSDIDGDGDGVDESSSIGMPFSAVPVVLIAP